jgi:hypothetical protein
MVSSRAELSEIANTSAIRRTYPQTTAEQSADTHYAKSPPSILRTLAGKPV